LQVVLSSTYWQFGPVTDPSVLRSEGAATVHPEPSGCVPGGGCGTATATYVAIAPGRSDVIANRVSCGEAMGCTSASGSYRVHVRVL
jgi:hypothetical protein